MAFLKDYSIYNRGVTANGNVARSTTQKKWDNPSIYFDGNGDYLTIPSSSDFGFGTGDFTIEFWSYRTSLDMTRGIFGFGYYYNGILFRTNSGGNPFYLANNYWDWQVDLYFPINIWTYFAIVRDGSNVQIYINGISRLSVTNNSNLGTSQFIRIGGSEHTIGFEHIYGIQDFKGFIDDFRITKGIAREISVPTESFLTLNDPYSDDVVLLLSGTEFIPNTSIIQQRNLNLSASPITNSLNGSVIEQRPQRSLLHGGKGSIIGTTVKVPSDIPVPRKVRLFEENSGLLIQEVWSDAAGNYVFNGLSDNYYFITAHDHTLEFNGVIQSHVRPEFPV